MGGEFGDEIEGVSPGRVGDKLTDKLLKNRLLKSDDNLSGIFSEVIRSGFDFSEDSEELIDFNLKIDRLKTLDYGGLESSPLDPFQQYPEKVRGNFYALIDIWPKGENSSSMAMALVVHPKSKLLG